MCVCILLWLADIFMSSGVCCITMQHWSCASVAAATEFVCFISTIISTPCMKFYICAWIKHTVHMFWQTIWQLSASIHVTLLCYVHAWPRQSSVLWLCSHALPYVHTFAYLMQLTFNLFLSAYTVRPADQSANGGTLNSGACTCDCEGSFSGQSCESECSWKQLKGHTPTHLGIDSNALFGIFRRSL